jgi:hypothetical protein
LKMPGIILPIIPSLIPRIKPLKSLFYRTSIRPIPIPMVMNYLLIQTPQGLSSPQRRLPRQGPNPDFLKFFSTISVPLLWHYEYNKGIFRVFFSGYMRSWKMA